MAPTGFLFSLPPSLFEDITLAGEHRAAAGAAAATRDPEQPSGSDAEEQEQSPRLTPSALAATEAASAPAKAHWNEAGATCIACGIGIGGPGFASASEQRQHFKTDWHRYNLRRRVAKRAPLSEEQFDRIVEEEEDVSSISGSDSADSSSSEEDWDDDDNEGAAEGEEAAGGSRRLGAQRRQQRAARKRRDAGKAPQLVFEAADGARLAVWRCLLYPDHHPKARPSDAQLLPELRRVRAAAAPWVVLLLRGGHFAGAVFRMRAGPPGKGQHAGGEPFEVVAHKTFHRYVVRCVVGAVADRWLCASGLGLGPIRCVPTSTPGVCTPTLQTQPPLQPIQPITPPWLPPPEPRPAASSPPRTPPASTPRARARRCGVTTRARWRGTWRSRWRSGGRCWTARGCE